MPYSYQAMYCGEEIPDPVLSFPKQKQRALQPYEFGEPRCKTLLWISLSAEHKATEVQKKYKEKEEVKDSRFQWHLLSSTQSLKGDDIYISVAFWTSTASAIAAPCDSCNLFISGDIIHLILSSLLFWMELLLAFQFYKQLYADDELSRLIVVLHVCRAAPCSITSPVGRQGSSWRDGQHSGA